MSLCRFLETPVTLPWDDCPCSPRPLPGRLPTGAAPGLLRLPGPDPPLGHAPGPWFGGGVTPELGNHLALGRPPGARGNGLWGSRAPALSELLCELASGSDPLTCGQDGGSPGSQPHPRLAPGKHRPPPRAPGRYPRALTQPWARRGAGWAGLRRGEFLIPSQLFPLFCFHSLLKAVLHCSFLEPLQDRRHPAPRGSHRAPLTVVVWWR